MPATIINVLPSSEEADQREALVKSWLVKHREQLKQWAVRVLDGKPLPFDASDVTHNAGLVILAHWKEFRGETEAEFLGWAREILTNRFISDVRKARTHKRSPEGGLRSLDDPYPDGQAASDPVDANQPTPSQEAMRQEDLERLRKALTQLPVNQAEAVRLRLEGWELPQIAERLGKTKINVSQLISRGMVALKQALEGDQQSGDDR